MIIGYKNEYFATSSDYVSDCIEKTNFDKICKDNNPNSGIKNINKCSIK
jgi:hypothetical protein